MRFSDLGQNGSSEINNRINIGRIVHIAGKKHCVVMAVVVVSCREGGEIHSIGQQTQIVGMVLLPQIIDIFYRARQSHIVLLKNRLIFQHTFLLYVLEQGNRQTSFYILPALPIERKGIGQIQYACQVFTAGQVGRHTQVLHMHRIITVF